MLPNRDKAILDTFDSSRKICWRTKLPTERAAFGERGVIDCSLLADDIPCDFRKESEGLSEATTVMLDINEARVFRVKLCLSSLNI